MNIRSLFVILAVAFISPVTGVAAPAAKAKPMMAMEEPSKEVREKMVTMHEQMVVCLKSDKKFSECHQQMMNSCPMMKDGKCPMMMHHGLDMKKGTPDDHSGHAGH